MTMVSTGKGVWTKSAWCGQLAYFITKAKMAHRSESSIVNKPAQPNT